MNKKDIKNLKELWEFLDADMPSKIFPNIEIDGEKWVRDNKFLDVKEVSYYLKQHFLLAFPKLKKDSQMSSNANKIEVGK